MIGVSPRLEVNIGIRVVARLDLVHEDCIAFDFFVQAREVTVRGLESGRLDDRKAKLGIDDFQVHPTPLRDNFPPRPSSLLVIAR